MSRSEPGDTDTDRVENAEGVSQRGHRKSNAWLLVPMVLDSRQDVRIAAITALINQSPPVLEGSVLEAVEGLEAKYKQDAARSLARSGDRRVLPLLGRITGTENEYVIPDDVSLESIRLCGVRLYASRYGSGYDPEDPVDLLLVDKNAKSLWSHSFPYDRIGYRAKWVDFKLPQPIPLKDHLRNGRLAIAIDPHAHQRKGVYFHYTAAAAGDPVGRGIVPGKKFFDAKGRNWMIRAFLTIDRD